MITYALMEKYDNLCEKIPDRARLITKAKVEKLIYENGKVVGAIYNKGG